MNLRYPLILASKSPRRQALLRELKLDFKVMAKEVEETFPSDLPANEVSRFIAVKKAEAYVEEVAKRQLILTSDTTVLLGESILGKPKDHLEAADMLSMLSGQTHQVITGVCLASPEKKIIFDETTEVTFRELKKEEIDFYIRYYQPLDKAGAYGIQEWIGMVGIQEIKGDYYNVVGLPLNKLWSQLQDQFSA